MKSSQEWNPATLLESPMFTPLHPVLARLGSGALPTIHDFNNLLADDYPAISVELGHNLNFVPQAPGKMGFESQYEPRCYLSGEVQTRSGNWHDLFNALVWLTFPKTKAAINSRHYHVLSHVKDNSDSQRGKVRDMATLLDESGVIVVSAKVELLELLRTFQWKQLFWERREQVCAAMGFYILGHGLYEKAMQPYVGMTGQGLLLHVPDDFFNWTSLVQLGYLDELVAGYMNNPAHCVSSRELSPVPLLGIPGWSTANNDAAYYDNTTYFRPRRRDC